MVSPTGSKLFVGTTDMGAWSSGNLCLAAGTYTLKAEYPGYLPATKTITVTAGVQFPVVSLVCTSDTTCVSGQERCSSTGVPQLCVNSKWVNQTPCVSPQVCVGGDCTLNKICTPGKKRCNGKVPQTCNAAGTAWVDGTACSVACTGEGVCSGDPTHPCSTTYPTGYCTDPTKTCKNGVCTDDNKCTCEGMNRNGEFDITCILEEQNKMLLYGSIGAIALLGILLLKKR